MVPSFCSLMKLPDLCISQNSPTGTVGGVCVLENARPMMRPCSASPSCAITRTWSPGTGGQHIPQPEPIQGESTGSQPVSTPSGCNVTFAVAVDGSTDVTTPNRGWLPP